MSNSALNIKNALGLLSGELEKVDYRVTLYICGGAEIILMGYEDRSTLDVDAIRENFEEPLASCIERVSKTLGTKFWLNNQVAPLAKKFGKGWKKTTVELFKESHLTVRGISRQDFISTKLSALVNRNSSRDEVDLIWLKPTKKELVTARLFVIKNNTDPIAEVVVDSFIEDLLR